MGGATPKDDGTGSLLQSGGDGDGNADRLVGSPPPHVVVGRHLSWKEGSSLETLSSRGNVDIDDDGANDDRRFRMNVPPLINKQHNACFR
jgi:hypothetical protein